MGRKKGGDGRSRRLLSSFHEQLDGGWVHYDLVLETWFSWDHPQEAYASEPPLKPQKVSGVGQGHGAGSDSRQARLWEEPESSQAQEFESAESSAPPATLPAPIPFQEEPGLTCEDEAGERGYPPLGLPQERVQLPPEGSSSTWSPQRDSTHSSTPSPSMSPPTCREGPQAVRQWRTSSEASTSSDESSESCSLSSPYSSQRSPRETTAKPSSLAQASSSPAPTTSPLEGDQTLPLGVRPSRNATTITVRSQRTSSENPGSGDEPGFSGVPARQTRRRRSFSRATPQAQPARPYTGRYRTGRTSTPRRRGG